MKLLNIIALALCLCHVLCEDEVKNTWNENRPKLSDCRQYEDMKFRRLCRKIVEDPMLDEMERHVSSANPSGERNKQVNEESLDDDTDLVADSSLLTTLIPATMGSTIGGSARSFGLNAQGGSANRGLSMARFFPQPSTTTTATRATKTLNSQQQFENQCLVCPSVDEIGASNSPDNMKTTTPWSYCLDYDPMRFPQFLNFGMCSCKGCLDVKTRQFDLTLTSKNLTVQIPVMYRKDATKEFKDCDSVICEEKLIAVPVGCYCAISTGMFKKST